MKQFRNNLLQCLEVVQHLSLVEQLSSGKANVLKRTCLKTSLEPRIGRKCQGKALGIIVIGKVYDNFQNESDCVISCIKS